jgi:hypothetical protein
VLTVGAKDDPERVPRRGCVCILLITEDGGTQPGTYARCFEHKRIARDNYDGD